MVSAAANGSTAPDYTVFGQSHLDLAWLWPVEETMRKTARTYANQLAEEIMLGGQNEYFLLDGSLAFGEIDYSTGKEVALPTK